MSIVASNIFSRRESIGEYASNLLILSSDGRRRGFLLGSLRHEHIMVLLVHVKGRGAGIVGEATNPPGSLNHPVHIKSMFSFIFECMCVTYSGAV